MEANLARAASVGLLIAGILGVSACSTSTDAALSMAKPAVTGTGISYTALGASDAAGYGASVTCNTAQNPVVSALPSCPGGTGYVPLIAAQLAMTGRAVTLNDLGISGAVVGPNIAALASSYGTNCSASAKPADFITDELPHLKGDESLITLFAGSNDTNAIVNSAVCGQLHGTLTAAQLPAFLATQITTFGQEFQSLTAAIHQKAPNAKIVIANLPNLAGIPAATSPQFAAAKSLFQSVSLGIDQNVLNVSASSGIAVVDLLCDTRSYAPANFSADGIHPNDLGYAAFAQAFGTQIQAATPAPPAADCASSHIASLIQTSTQSVLHAVPAFDTL